LLGPYWRRLDTDFAAVGEALLVANDVLRIVPPEAQSAVAGHVCGLSGNEAVVRIAAQAGRSLQQWQSTLRGP
jgi:hypothetical protein